MTKYSSMTEEIQQLKRDRDAVILAHYYVPGDVQSIADHVGDSFALAQLVTLSPQKTIVFCGVSFMGESAKILNPDKTVLLPELYADCPMAHMADVREIERLKETIDDLAVVCYINSDAELKVHANVCVTSANAVSIVRGLPNKNICFIPDENLGRYVASQIPEKHFVFTKGYCHVHVGITSQSVKAKKEEYPDALVLAHPECAMDVLALADHIASTSGIITYANASDGKEFIICTESGVLHSLKEKNPDKEFHLAGTGQICPDMKTITVEKVLDSLRYGRHEVEIEETLRCKAFLPLARMMEEGS